MKVDAFLIKEQSHAEKLKHFAQLTQQVLQNLWLSCNSKHRSQRNWFFTPAVHKWIFIIKH